MSHGPTFCLLLQIPHHYIFRSDALYKVIPLGILARDISIKQGGRKEFRNCGIHFLIHLNIMGRSLKLESFRTNSALKLQSSQAQKFPKLSSSKGMY